MTSPNLFAAQQARARQEQQVLQSGAQAARHFQVVKTNGYGHIQVPDTLNFGVYFTEEPVFTSGSRLDDGVRLVNDIIPVPTLGIYDWIINPQGLYTGCHIYVTIEYSYPAALHQAQIDLMVPQICTSCANNTGGGSASASGGATPVIPPSGVVYDPTKYGGVTLPRYKMQHWFCFEGVAMRPVDAAVAVELSGALEVNTR